MLRLYKTGGGKINVDFSDKIQIDLNSELSFKNAFMFPLQNHVSRKELLKGGVLLLIPFIGWLFNMGHRIHFVHKMQYSQRPWPSWTNYWFLLKQGSITFIGMVYYYLPSVILMYLANKSMNEALFYISFFLFVIATFLIPGFMSHYCKNFQISEIFNPLISFRRVYSTGFLYWKAWLIALCALAISTLGLLILGIGFLFTSVWFWQVAGFSFAKVFSEKFKLIE